MEEERKKRSDQEKKQPGQDSKRLLEKLRNQLYSSNGSIRRQAGFHLSWLQEDGLEILKAALFGNTTHTTKNAAAYGLRNMRGRMKKMALEVFKQGLEHQDKAVREVCAKALTMLGEITPKKAIPEKVAPPKVRIKEIPAKRKIKSKISMERTPGRKPHRK